MNQNNNIPNSIQIVGSTYAAPATWFTEHPATAATEQKQEALFTQGSFLAAILHIV